MNYFNRKFWITTLIVFLLLTNVLSLTIIAYNYYKQDGSTERIFDEASDNDSIVIPRQHLGRFFREQLDLDREQHSAFRAYRRAYHQQAETIGEQLDKYRQDLWNELGKAQADSLKLQQIADSIGMAHSELKQATIDYYLNLRAVCAPEQQQELHRIFQAMRQSEVHFRSRMHRNGRGHGQARGRYRNQ